MLSILKKKMRNICHMILNWQADTREQLMFF